MPALANEAEFLEGVIASQRRSEVGHVHQLERFECELGHDAIALENTREEHKRARRADDVSVLDVVHHRRLGHLLARRRRLACLLLLPRLLRLDAHVEPRLGRLRLARLAGRRAGVLLLGHVQPKVGAVADIPLPMFEQRLPDDLLVVVVQVVGAEAE